MKNNRLSRLGLRWGLLLLTLASAWVLPPAVHRLLRYCPVRPDGVGAAEALPSFARKYKMSCAQCHTGFPVLNEYGRQFKLNGFVRERGGSEGVLKSQDEQLAFESMVPWALIVRSRPFDNGKGTISNQGAQMGGTNSPNSNGFKAQPVNDVDAFIAGGDAARSVSYLGELDANHTNGFTPTTGDIRLGYHPFTFLNVIAARRNFFADDPYQTIVSNESPTIANRATDLLMSGQNSITGNTLLTMQQSLGVNGQIDLVANSFLYYAAALSKDSDSGRQWNSPTNGSARLAFDTGKGLMVGLFGSYGRERPSAVGGIGGNLNVDNGIGTTQAFTRGGFDALWEMGSLAARGAFVFSRDSDKLVRNAESNRAAYAELAYYWKRGGAAYPFLVPLVRENWYTTTDGTAQFNYVTTQLAHYFAPNTKAFVEYSIDTKRDMQGGQLNPLTRGTVKALRGNRVTAQLEVGF